MQQALKLSDKEVEVINEAILGQTGGRETSEIEKPIVDQKEAEAQKRKKEERIRQQQEIENRSKVTEFVADYKPTNKEGIKLREFEFGMVTVSLEVERARRFGLGSKVKVNKERSLGKAQYFTEDLGNGVGLDMVYIPGGKFMMGAPKGEGNKYEKPQHEVKVQPFFISKFQITQAQWRVIASRQDLRVERNLEAEPSRFKGDDLPVGKISWDDAQEFDRRLSKQTGKKYRLPSEAEWEYACRAGTTTQFHFGETISREVVNCKRNSAIALMGLFVGETREVGSFKASNAFGLYDMHGNVWEWCEDDDHDSYKGAPLDGSAWLSGANNISKIIRGGAWNNNPYNCRSACRNNSTRGNRSYDIGFRVVCVSLRKVRPELAFHR